MVSAVRLFSGLLFIVISSVSSIAMTIFENEDKLILVHASSVLSENNKKIAGAQSHVLSTGHSFIENEGINIRKRITLHHCLGGIVPADRHGIDPFHAGQLDADLDGCAYLDSLSAFRGEVFGGSANDFMTIDSHVYGESSIIIIPQHREADFHSKNPNYKGKLIVFDAHQISLREKVNETIKQLGAPSFSEINDKNYPENFASYCKKHNYFDQEHDATILMFFEIAVNGFHKTIDFINRDVKASALVPADQVGPLAIVIETLLEYIGEQLSSSTLNRDKLDAVSKWINDTQIFLSLFKKDASLRLHKNKSYFINKSNYIGGIGWEKSPDIYAEKTRNIPTIDQVIQIIKQRNFDDFLLEEEKNLPVLRDENLAKGDGELFPKHSIDRVHQFSSTFIRILRKNLMEKGYSSHADEVMLVYLMKLLGSGLEQDGDLVSDLLDRLAPSPELTTRLQEALEDALKRDASFRNQNTISWLNSDLGKLLRKKIFMDSSDIDYWELLKAIPTTAVLFNDVNAYSPPENRLHNIARQWILHRARSASNSPVLAHQSVHGSTNLREERLKNAPHSLFNYQHAAETVFALESYRLGLIGKAGYLQNLIDQGCFTSWGDLFVQLFDIDGLSKQDIKKVVEENLHSCPSPLYLGLRMEDYRRKLEEDKETFSSYMPIYEEIYNQMANAGDKIDESKFDFWSWYIDTLLPQCIYGYHQKVGENEVLIDPNWQRATILYKKLYEVASVDYKKRLDEMMKPVFAAELTKELTLKQNIVGSQNTH